MLNGLGRNICKEVLEAADERIREQREKRPGRAIERRNDQKTVLSPLLHRFAVYLVTLYKTLLVR